MGDATSVIEQLVERWNAHDKEGTAALYDDAAEIEAPGGVRVSGRDGWRSFYDLWTSAFPDNAVAGAVVRGGGDLAVQEARFTGTHTGTLHAPSGDIPATGRRVDIRYTGVHSVRGGLITSMHLYFDQAEMLIQLGLMPAPAAAG
jgi:ketosteroid isomerase-like protein